LTNKFETGASGDAHHAQSLKEALASGDSDLIDLALANALFEMDVTEEAVPSKEGQTPKD